MFFKIECQLNEGHFVCVICPLRCAQPRQNVSQEGFFTWPGACCEVVEADWARRGGGGHGAHQLMIWIRVVRPRAHCGEKFGCLLVP